MHIHKERAQGFLSRRKGVLVGTGLLILTLVLLTGGRREMGPPGRSAGVVTTPAQSLTSGIVGSVSSVLDRYVFLASAEEEILKLRGEVDGLKRELLKVKEYEYENQRLKALLGFKETTELPLLPSRVTGRSASAWYRTMVLDKGLADGVRMGSPVVTAGGVVGRVYEVGSSSARVLLLTDASSGVDAILQRSRAQVVVEGDLGPNPKILYLARGVDVEVGDKVVTSGLDGIFPKGLVLGEVSRLKSSPGEIFQSARLEPGADFSSIEEVFVILPRTEKAL